MKKHSPWGWIPSLYFAEGLPYVMVMIVSVVMYKQMGLSNAEITFYTSWLYLPWVVKPLWSPFVDILRTKRWWIVSMQMLIGAAFAGVALTLNTDVWLRGTLCFFWLLAFSSATHDIAADGFYMLGLDTHQQATFVGIRSTFYRLATIFGQGVLIMLAGWLQESASVGIGYSWSLMFYALAGLFVGLFAYHRHILPRPAEDRPRAAAGAGAPSAVWAEMKNSVKTFIFDLRPDGTFRLRDEALAGILFMILYRMPEAFIAKVAPLFMLDSPESGGLGLTAAEFGFAQGTVGVVGLTLGGILGGLCAGRHGLRRWLWPMVAAITLPDVVYVYLCYSPSVGLTVVNVCIFVEQFGYGFGFTAYMLYLIYYSAGRYKTSHYALCTALMALSMMLPGLVAGALQEWMGYGLFFVFVMASCLVTFLVTARLRIDPRFGMKSN